MRGRNDRFGVQGKTCRSPGASERQEAWRRGSAGKRTKQYGDKRRNFFLLFRKIVMFSIKISTRKLKFKQRKCL